MRSALRILFAALAFGLIGAGCKRDTPSPAPPAVEKTPPPSATSQETPEPTPERPKRPPPKTIRIVTADRTSEAERPVDLSEALKDLAVKAAADVGFTLSDNGHRAEVEVYYALTQNGRPDPKAERGLLVYAAEARLRLVDDQGLGEIIEGRSSNEAPFVRAAIPDLNQGFRTLVSEAVTSALRDVSLQIDYRDRNAADALGGLSSQVAEERWAAARRLGDLGEKKAIRPLLALLADSEALETGVIAGVLGRIGDNTAVAPLMARIEGVPTEVGVLIVDALAAIGTPEARDAIRRVLDTHPLEAVRAAANEHVGARPP